MIFTSQFYTTVQIFVISEDMGGKNTKIQAYGKTVKEERDTEIKKWAHILEKRKKDLNIS